MTAYEPPSSRRIVGAATWVMVESSRSITAAVMTAPNATHRHCRPTDPAGPEDPAEPASVAGSLPARCANEPAMAGSEFHRAGWLAVLLAGDDIGSSRVLAEQNLLFQF